MLTPVVLADQMSALSNAADASHSHLEEEEKQGRMEWNVPVIADDSDDDADTDREVTGPEFNSLCVCDEEEDAELKKAEAQHRHLVSLLEAGEARRRHSGSSSKPPSVPRLVELNVFLCL